MKGLFQWILNDFWYKFAAFAFAIIIWGIVQGEEIVEVNRRIKVNIAVPEGLGVRGKPVRYVNAIVRGPRVLLNDDDQAIEANVNVLADQRGLVEIPFEYRFLRNWDTRLKIIVRDSFLKIYVDELVNQRVAVKELLFGAPADGHFIEKVVLRPSNVSLNGLKSNVVQLDKLVTEPIDISNIEKTQSFEAKLALSNELGINTISNEVVSVTVHVAALRKSKTFEKIPIKVPGFKVRTTPETVSVTLRGPPELMDLIAADQILATVNLSEVPTGEYRRVNVVIPREYELVSFEPKEVKVLVRKK